MRTYRVKTTRLSDGGERLFRFVRRAPRMRASVPSFFRLPGVRLGVAKRNVDARALTVTEDLEVVAFQRRSLELNVASTSQSDDDELIINGDPNEVVKTLSARRSLEVVYGSDSESRGHERASSSHPVEERKLMEQQWGSASASSTVVPPVVSSKRSKRKENLVVGKGKTRRSRRAARQIDPEPIGENLDEETSLMSRLEADLMKGSRIDQGDSAMGLWFRRITNCLLTIKEESTLGGIIQKGQEISKTRTAMKKASGATPKEELLAKELNLTIPEMRKRWKRMERARWLLVAYNLRAVVPIAKSMVSPSTAIEFTDLLGAGRDGLVRAAERFDPGKGKFVTYAHLWIKQSIQRCLREDRLIHLPAHVCENLSKIYVYCQGVSDTGKTDTSKVSPKEISKALSIPEPKVKTYMRASRPPVSFDATLNGQKAGGGDDTRELHELIADNQSSDVVMDTTIKENLNMALSTLPPRERNIIRMRYGLCGDGEDSMTFKDIGTTYGLSNEWIRKIEDSGMQKLRKPWRRALLQIPEIEGKLS